MARTSTRKQLREAAAAHFGLFFDGVITAEDSGAKTITVPAVAKQRANMDLFNKAFVTVDGADFELVTKVPDPGGVMTLRENLAVVAGTDVAGIYLMLTPMDWNKIIDRTLTSELFRQKIYSVPLVDNDNEYLLPEDIQSRADVVDVKYRVALSPVVETPAVSWKLIENDHGVTLHLPDMWVAQAGSASIDVIYNERYAALVSDTSSTTCPFDLAWSAVAVRATDFLRSAYGESIAQRFNAPRNDALRMRTELKALHMPPVTTREFNVEAAMDQDIPTHILESGSW